MQREANQAGGAAEVLVDQEKKNRSQGVASEIGGDMQVWVNQIRSHATLDATLVQTKVVSGLCEGQLC